MIGRSEKNGVHNYTPVSQTLTNPEATSAQTTPFYLKKNIRLISLGILLNLFFRPIWTLAFEQSLLGLLIYADNTFLYGTISFILTLPILTLRFLKKTDKNKLVNALIFNLIIVISSLLLREMPYFVHNFDQHRILKQNANSMEVKNITFSSIDGDKDRSCLLLNINPLLEVKKSGEYIMEISRPSLDKKELIFTTEGPFIAGMSKPQKPIFLEKGSHELNYQLFLSKYSSYSVSSINYLPSQFYLTIKIPESYSFVSNFMQFDSYLYSHNNNANSEERIGKAICPSCYETHFITQTSCDGLENYSKDSSK